MNKRTNKAPVSVHIVTNSNTALPTNATALFGTGTSMNIANDQIGIVSNDNENSTHPAGTLVNTDMNAAGIKAFSFVQGTPVSSNITQADVWGYGHKSHLQSQVMTKSNIRSISTYKANVGTRNVHLINPTTVLDESEYKVSITVTGTKSRRDFGYNPNRNSVSYVTPDYSALSYTSDLDHMLTNLAYRMNLHSELMPLVNAVNSSNRPYVVLGLSLDGSASGVAIGTITAGTSVPFATVDGQSYSYTFDATDIATFNEMLDDASISAATEIVPINVSTAGANGIDALVVIGLDDKQAVAYDDIFQMRNRLMISLMKTFDAQAVRSSEIVNAAERTNYGRELTIEWGNTSRMFQGNMQVQPQGDFFAEPQNYIKENSYYTSTTFDYMDMNTGGLYNDTVVEKRATVLLPCTVTVGNVSAGVTYATTATTTVTNLNTCLANFLGNATNNIQYNGDAAAATPFA